MRDLEKGEILDGRFEIQGVIGSGGMGKVYRARQINLDRPVALKIPTAAIMSDPEYVARFGREAMTVARFQHENIVAIHDVCVEADRAYICMELVDGQPLDRFLREGHWSLRTDQVVDLLVQIALGLRAAHDQGVIHRDIKPANIFVTTRGHRVKIMDFGIARVSDATSLTMSGTTMGTPQYMSPEQIQGKDLGPASDIYALAVLSFQVLTLTQLFEGELTTLIFKHLNEPPPQAHARNPRLPRAVEAVFAKGLAKDPGARHQTATQYAEELARAMEPCLQMPYSELLKLPPERLAALKIPKTAPRTGQRSESPTQSMTPLPRPMEQSSGLQFEPPKAPTPPPTPVQPTPPPLQRTPTSPPVQRPSGPAPGSLPPPATASMATYAPAAPEPTPTPAPTPQKRRREGPGLASKILLAPFRLFGAIPARGKVILVILALAAGGGWYLTTQVNWRLMRQRIFGQPARGSAPAATAAPMGQNVPPTISLRGAPLPSRLTDLNIDRGYVDFSAGDSDGSISHFEVRIDGGEPEVIQPSAAGGSFRGRWQVSRDIPAGPHHVVIDAVDDQGGRSRPPLQFSFVRVTAEGEEGAQMMLPQPGMRPPPRPGEGPPPRWQPGPQDQAAQG